LLAASPDILMNLSGRTLLIWGFFPSRIRQQDVSNNHSVSDKTEISQIYSRQSSAEHRNCSRSDHLAAVSYNSYCGHALSDSSRFFVMSAIPDLICEVCQETKYRVPNMACIMLFGWNEGRISYEGQVSQPNLYPVRRYISCQKCLKLYSRPLYIFMFLPMWSYLDQTAIP